MRFNTAPQKCLLLPTFRSAYLWSPSQLNPLDMTFGKLPISVIRLGQQMNLQGDWLMHITILLKEKEAGNFPKGTCVHSLD